MHTHTISHLNWVQTAAYQHLQAGKCSVHTWKLEWLETKQAKGINDSFTYKYLLPLPLDRKITHSGRWPHKNNQLAPSSCPSLDTPPPQPPQPSALLLAMPSHQIMLEGFIKAFPHQCSHAHVVSMIAPWYTSSVNDLSTDALTITNGIIPSWNFFPLLTEQRSSLHSFNNPVQPSNLHGW